MYHAPLKDQRFVLGELLRVQQLAAFPCYAEFSSELADSILEQAARFAEEVLAPINVLGDTRGALFEDGVVRMPAEFRDAYAKFVAAGWPQLSAPTALGGQGVPLAVAVAAEEIWFGSNLAFMLCPQLSRGAVDALVVAATPALQALLLPKLVSGKWTGTMNLAELTAGSDLARHTHAREAPRAGARISRTKKISSPTGSTIWRRTSCICCWRVSMGRRRVKGISPVAIPDVLRDADGHLGEANDVRCVPIEHELGVHAARPA